MNIMAREPITERIRFDSPAETVFVNFQRYAATENDPRINVPPIPIYDFGRLLNHSAPEYIGDDRFGEIARSQDRLTREIGFRLPHPACAFLHRYDGETPAGAVSRVRQYFFLGLGIDDGSSATVTWFSWSREEGWTSVLSHGWRGQSNTFEMTEQFMHPDLDMMPETRTMLRGTLVAAIQATLWLIYERGGAVVANELPPMPTRSQTGRMRVHPLAPTSVIRIRVNDPRLLRPSEPPTSPQLSEPPTAPTEPQEPVQRRPARGTTVHYKHPRYVNMQGKTGFRRAQHGHPDAEQPPPTYEAEDD